MKQITSLPDRIIPGVLSAEYSPATYKTKDGSGLYKFRYVQKSNGKFEIDILSQPSYAGRSSDSHKTHRLTSSRRGKKICIAVGKEPTSISTAKNISTQWAELTNTYIKTGKAIDSQVRENTGSNGGGGILSWLFAGFIFIIILSMC